MSPYKLKGYIGFDGRFCFCEDFPSDEHHAFLDDYLREFQDQLDWFRGGDDGFTGAGFYMFYFSIEVEQSHPECGDHDSYLVVDKIERINPHHGAGEEGK